TPSAARSCISRAPVNSTPTCSGLVPLPSRVACHVRAAGSLENRCGAPVASAWARVSRRWPATSLAAERRRLRCLPPPRLPTPRTPAMAISPTTTSTSISENPRRGLLLEPDIRIHALAARLPVRAVADDVVAPAIAGHPELERRIPGIVELGLGR